ncbi:MAG: hypothetical protein ACREMY_29210, partial [bacterium]
PRTRSDSFGTSHGPCSCDLNLETTDAELERILSILTPRESGRGEKRPLPSALPSGTARYGRAELTCLKPHDRRSPFWVVRASDDVVHEHSGIFTSYLMDFIRHVIFEALEREGRIGR